MKSRLFSTIFVLVLFLALGVSAARADYGGANGQSLAPMGQAFTYQGQLKDSSGNPVDDSCDFRFILYDAEVGGVQIGPIQNKTNIRVTDGYFTVGLDFGSSAFLGEARWLAVEVRCPAGGGSYTPLSPRQALTPAPYALNADLLDGQHATAFSTTGHNHWGQSWTGSGTGLILSGGTIGLLGSGSAYGVYGGSDSNSGTGIYGITTATTGPTFGVRGTSSSPEGYGVYGYGTATTGITSGVIGVSNSISGSGVFGSANSTSGTTVGVYGSASSTEGTGVYGYAPSTIGGTYGVYGMSVSISGTGVHGLAANTTGTTFGVYGQSNSAMGTGVRGYATHQTGVTNGVSGLATSTNGRGVYGYASSDSGLNFGVYGVSNSTTGMGVYGEANAATGSNWAVYGWAPSTSGTGVLGHADSTTGTTYGVSGQSDSTAGTGVYGYANNTSGVTFGVQGRADSNNGTGVFGFASNAAGPVCGVTGQSESISGLGVSGLAGNNSGINSVGVYGRGDGNEGYGVTGHNYYGGVGVGAWSYSGNLIEAYSGDFPGGTLQFYITGAGNVYANGTYNSFKTSNLDGETHATSSIQSTEVWLEDFGHGDIMNGLAVITIAPDFTGMANLSAEYMVFVTLEGDCQGVFITNKTPTTFEVHELNGGTSNVPFGYRIVAKQMGSEIVRLPTVTIPATVDVPRQPDDASQILTPPLPLQAPEPPEQGQLPDQVQP